MYTNTNVLFLKNLLINLKPNDFIFIKSIYKHKDKQHKSHENYLRTKSSFCILYSFIAYYNNMSNNEYDIIISNPFNQMSIYEKGVSLIELLVIYSKEFNAL